MPKPARRSSRVAALALGCAMAFTLPSAGCAAARAVHASGAGPVGLSPGARKRLLELYDRFLRAVVHGDAGVALRATAPAAVAAAGGERVDWGALGWAGRPLLHRQITGDDLGWQGAATGVRLCVAMGGKRIECAIEGHLTYTAAGRWRVPTDALALSDDLGATWRFVAADARALPPGVSPDLELRTSYLPAPLDAVEAGFLPSARPLFDGCVASAPAASVRRYGCPGFLAEYELVLEPLDPASVLERARSRRRSRVRDAEVEEPVTLRLAGRDVAAMRFLAPGADEGDPPSWMAVARDGVNRLVLLTCSPGTYRPAMRSCPAVLEYLAAGGPPEHLAALGPPWR